MSDPYRARFARRLLASKIRALIWAGVKIQLPSGPVQLAIGLARRREASHLSASDDLTLSFLSAGDKRAGQSAASGPIPPGAPLTVFRAMPVGIV